MKKENIEVILGYWANNEFKEQYEKVTGKKVNYKLVDRREGDITAAYADTNYANDELGWKTQLTLDQALLSAWKWQETL